MSAAASAAAQKAAHRSRAAARARARLLALSAVLDDLAERSCLSCAAQGVGAANDPPPCSPRVADDAGAAAAYARPAKAALPACTCDDTRDVFSAAAAVLPRSSGLDALLVGAAERARVSSGACVCALVYVGRVHAGGAAVPLRRSNVRALLVGALALASGYVDRRTPGDVARRLSRACALPPQTVLLLRDALATALHGHTYISPATFREYDSILDDLVAPR